MSAKGLRDLRLRARLGWLRIWIDENLLINWLLDDGLITEQVGRSLRAFSKNAASSAPQYWK